ncbi:DNA repair and recombination protein RAD54B isoform X1 [Harpegnathos saltator]|uniref:DNA repair and recombination protein RAD54B isoform X1 n=1 Tax=Harpegnathos saltator TaxID=610380 RepID=UPI000DBEEC18|nr:DNA repair and recombination protein RAD54B isoform X1 [Harpegnathos saltator]
MSYWPLSGYSLLIILIALAMFKTIQLATIADAQQGERQHAVTEASRDSSASTKIYSGLTIFSIISSVIRLGLIQTISDATVGYQTVDFSESMYRNKPVKGFQSPLIVLNRNKPPTSAEKANDASRNQQKVPNNSTKPFRSNSQILSLFEEAIRENDDNYDNIVETNPSKKEKSNDNPAGEKKTSTVASRSKVIFNVVYGKISSKKHKTWDGDGLLEVAGKSAVLKDLDGNVIGRATVNPSNAVEGSRLIIASKEIEIIDQASEELSVVSEKRSEETVEEPLQKKFKACPAYAFVPPLPKKGLTLNCKPLVMPYMNSTAIWISQEASQKEQEVSVDSCLVAMLREHQRHGIVFLYECLMGLKVANYFGGILADEMGLGKTLQCITLIWTMLKKGPYSKPILKRALILAPSSLCDNWKKEFAKWLGCHRVSPFVVDGKNKPKDFTSRPRNSVMIISYEMFIRCHMEINEIAFDLIVCDEGHRLKNSNIKAAKLLYEVNCKKRIILTGTPIQNDLKEFYALVDFVNPSILGTPSEYRNYYEDPIVASQSPHASDDVLSLGNERAMELHECTKRFILRRTQETINKYLPCKHEMVLFCSLSSKQEDLYSLVTDAWFDRIFTQDKTITHLTIITALKKICNHPSLFTNDKGGVLYDALSTRVTPTKHDENFTRYCGKITIVQTLMRNLKNTNEKLVLVSYYTQTLDLLQTVCSVERLKYLRLDGATSTTTRSKVIEQFNTKTDESKILLLSAKAGGVGLNLPGASRLVLFDSDWNPASDMQAMARIWRDGQKKDVYIYRLLTTGTIEEKIYQRQISKAGLSEFVVDLNHLRSLKLSTEELKDLFTLTTDTVSVTHDLMNCSCSGKNNEHISIEKFQTDNGSMRDCQFVLQDKSSTTQNLTINQLLDWQHYKQPILPDIMQITWGLGIGVSLGFYSAQSFIE